MLASVDSAMLASAELVAFVPTADPERSREFYEGTLSLPLVEQTAFACVYQTANAQLRVTLVPHPAQAAYTVLGWRVSNIEATAAWLRKRGIDLLRYEGMAQDELGIWRAPS